MPIYNAEKFLKKSITSIMNQSIGFENIELLLVDDKSTDSSKKIMESYSNKYSNIKTFYSSINYGYPGHGRNIGLMNSNAPYIMFIDNDDEYDEKYCEKMLNTMYAEDCDVACANYKMKFKEKTNEISCFSKIEDYTYTSHNNKLVDLNRLSKLNDSEVWTKIFKKSIITENNIKFVEKNLAEDTLFLFEYYAHAKKLIYLDYTGYTWHRDHESLSTSSKTPINYIKSYYNVLNFLKNHHENLDYNYFCQKCVEVSIIRTIYSDDKKSILKELYNFEKTIKFSGELTDKWLTFINNFILKQKFTFATFILNLLFWFKRILDYLRKIK